MNSVVFDHSPDLRSLSLTVSANLNPDLRDLTTYVGLLQLPTFTVNQNSQEAASALAVFLDRPLAAAVAQIAAFKEIEAPLSSTKDSSLRTMSSILESLARKAIGKSLAFGGIYTHPFHVFYEDFGEGKTVSKNSFYGYKSALTRYALKKVTDLLPNLPSNVDKHIAGSAFSSALALADSPGGDSIHPHRITQAILDPNNFSLLETNPKLANYPWLAGKRHRSALASGPSPMLTILELIELVECVRFICHYAPDLKYERRGFAGSKRSREFSVFDLMSDGLLLNVPKPKFSINRTFKRSFDKMSPDEKRAVSSANKRIGSTAFDPLAFWQDVVRKIDDDAVKAAIAVQLITGCRPSEVVEGVVVSADPPEDLACPPKITFLVFGSKTKAPTASKIPSFSSDQHQAYAAFLERSSIALNARIRGQFYHTETHDVLDQFPERTWLYQYLIDRDAKQVKFDNVIVARFLDEKRIQFRKLPKARPLPPPLLEALPRSTTGIQDVSPQGATKSSSREEEKLPSDDEDSVPASKPLPAPIISSCDFETYLTKEAIKILAARQAGGPRPASPLENAKIIRFSFLPKQDTFPLMSAFDGILFAPSNVDKAAAKASRPRQWLLNEFSMAELDNMRIPGDHRHMLSSAEFAALEKERAEYRAAAVIRLSERYQTAFSGQGVQPTPYVARHKLLSDLKGLKHPDGTPAYSREDIARKAGHASTVTQTGYGKSDYAEKGSKNRAQGLGKIQSQSDVKNPSSTAGKRVAPARDVTSRPSLPSPPRYEPRD